MADEATEACASNALTEPAPAQITLLYESRDGKMCLFEDAEGHIVAVRASKLA